MRSICPTCLCERDTHIVHKLDTLPVCGEPTDVEADIRVCDVCGEEIADLELDGITILKAYAIYRSRHGLLGPDEALAIRERYSLTQREFARLLGWSPATVNRYERTGCMSSAHNQVLRAMQDQAGVQRLLDSRSPVLTREEAAKYNTKLIRQDQVGQASDPEQETLCPSCGGSVGKTDRFCKHCGVSLSEAR